MRLNAKQVVACTGGTILVEPLDARSLMTGVTWDSREVQDGWLYVALPGERVDGHDFVAAALRAGAAGALVMQAPDAPTQLLAREMGAAVIEVAATAAAINAKITGMSCISTINRSMSSSKWNPVFMIAPPSSSGTG